jgi:hypothetical protein
MPDKIYQLIYRGDNSDLLSKNQQLVQSLQLLDQLCTQVQGKLKTYASGSSRSAQQAAKSALQLAQALSKVEIAATNARSKLNGYATGGAQAVGPSARAAAILEAQLKSLARQANAVRSAIARAGAASQTTAGQIGNLSAQAAAANGGLAGVAASAKQINQSVKGLKGSVDSIAGSLAAFTLIRQAFHAIMEASKEIEDRWHKLAGESAEFRDRLRELSNIKGESGPTDKTYAEVLQLALEMGTTPEKAEEFARSYENIGPTIRAKGHYQPAQGSAEQLERSVQVEAGITARRFGLDEGAAGEAIGTAGLFHTFTTTEDAMNQYGMALSGLSQGKLDYNRGVRALNKAAAKLVDPNDNAEFAQEMGLEGLAPSAPGRVRSFGEAGIYLGALSLGTGTADQAHQRMIQISRTLNTTDEDQQKVLQAAGISREMDDPAKLSQLGKYLKQQGERDPLSWLARNKIGSQATREAVVAGLKVTDVLDQRLAAARGGGANAFGKQIMAENAAFRASDRGFLNAEVEAARTVGDKTEGRRVELFEAANKLAEERMRLGDQDYNTAGRSIVLGAFSPVTYALSGVSGFQDARERHEQFGSIPTLRREAKRLGIDIDAQFPGLNSGAYEARAQAFEGAYKAVMAKDPTADPLGRGEVRAKAQRRVQAIAAAGNPGGVDVANGIVAPGAAGGAGDPALKQIQAEQLRVLKQINDKVGGGAPAPAPLAPLGPAPVPGGPRRIGG